MHIENRLRGLSYCLPIFNSKAVGLVTLRLISMEAVGYNSSATAGCGAVWKESGRQQARLLDFQHSSEKLMLLLLRGGIFTILR